MSPSRLRATALALGLGLLIAPALSGCIPAVDDLVGGIVQQGIESGVEGLTGVDVAPGQLPEGFPSDVPIAEGELVGGAAVAGEAGKAGWIVNVTTSQSPQDVQAQLEAAGFRPQEGLESLGLETGGMFVGENDRYQVLVVFADADGQTSVTYTVGQK